MSGHKAPGTNFLPEEPRLKKADKGFKYLCPYLDLYLSQFKIKKISITFNWDSFFFFLKRRVFPDEKMICRFQLTVDEHSITFPFMSSKQMCSLQLLPRPASILWPTVRFRKPIALPRAPRAGKSLGQNSYPHQNKHKSDIISVLPDCLELMRSNFNIYQ